MRYHGLQGGETPAAQCCRAARRYVVLFATQDAEGEPTPIPEELAQQVREINAEGGGRLSPADVRESDDASARGRVLWRQRRLPEARKLRPRKTGGLSATSVGFRGARSWGDDRAA